MSSRGVSAARGETRATDVQTQQFRGLRSIDDPVHRRVDRTISGGGGTATWNDATKRYHETDAQLSPVAMLTHSAELAERTSSTSYGVARHSWLGDVDRDGDVDSNDVSAAAFREAAYDVYDRIWGCSE